MPRALPALLETAMDAAVFKAYLAIGKRNYTGTPPASLSGYTTLVTNILYYKYDGLELTVKWASPNLPEDDGITLGDKYYIERGVTIAGVNHTIKSASMRFDDYTIHKQIITAQFSLFSSHERPDSVAGDDTYTNILTALNPNAYELGTVDFKATPENSGHWDYQFYGAGKQVTLKSYNSLLPILQQKYLIAATDNSDDDNEDEIQFFHLSSPITTAQWEERLTTDKAIHAAAFAPALPLFVAVGIDSGNTAYYTKSTNGTSWDAPALMSISFQPYSICWSSALSLFVAAGINGATKNIATSPDGITWTERTAASGFNSVIWVSTLNLFVAVGTKIFTSPDGITWTERTKPNTNNWNSVCWASALALLVAVSSGGGAGERVMTSPDGITWTERTAAENNNWTSVCWSSTENILVAVSETGTNRVMTSPDGITWTSRTAAAANAWQAVTYSDYHNYFEAVSNTGTGNRLMTSPDGITWTSDTTSTDSAWKSILWDDNNTIFVLTATGTTSINKITTSIELTLTVDHIIDQGDVTLKTDALSRGFLWRDEAGTINVAGNQNNIIHNLGYLESTDSPPASYANSDRAAVVVGIHLKYKTGDVFTLKINDDQIATYYAKVTEILDPNAEIGWRCEIELMERFGNTDGGPLPSTIERVAAYTPLVTTAFNGLLDATVNNLQAFAEKVDNLIITNFSGILLPANGGTGINNSTRTLAINTNSGTLAFASASSTLTIPATGTAALLGTANVFTADQKIATASNPTFTLDENNSGTDVFQMIDVSPTQAQIRKISTGGNALIDIDPIPAGTSAASFRFFRSTNTSGAVSFDVYKGNNTATINCSFAGNGNSYVGLDSGNFGIGTSTFGTNADSVLALFNGTAPTTSPADTVQLFSVDLSAGNATLGIRTETAVVTESVTSDRTLSVKINGTTYKICLKA